MSIPVLVLFTVIAGLLGAGAGMVLLWSKVKPRAAVAGGAAIAAAYLALAVSPALVEWP